jgi:type IV pilus assembly protein PilM
MNMLFKLSARKKSVGLEIKDYVIRYVEGRNGAAPLASSFGEVYVPPSVLHNGVIADARAFEMILRNCAAKWGLKNKQVHFIVPDAYVVVRKQSIPADITEEEIRGYIFLELGRSIHLPFEQPTFDYAVLGKKEDKKDLLLFAAPENLVESYANILEKVKMHPVSADLTSLAFGRLYDAMEQPEEEEMMLVKLDALDANITIFQNGTPVFMQHYSFSYAEAVEITPVGIEVQNRELILAEAEEFLEEISRILHFYQYSFAASAGSIQKLLLIGDHPLLEDLYTMLQERFSFTVTSVSYSSVAGKGELLHPKYYPAFGLTLKGV